MSDFDKFFADKLDEETPHPRMGKNWKSLSSRLNAFDAGMTGGQSHLRFWQLAAVGLVVITLGLVWKIQSFQRENAGLRERVAVLEKKYDPTFPVAPEHRKNIVDTNSPGTSANEKSQTSEHFDLVKTLTPNNLPLVERSGHSQPPRIRKNWGYTPASNYASGSKPASSTKAEAYSDNSTPNISLPQTQLPAQPDSISQQKPEALPRTDVWSAIACLPVGLPELVQSTHIRLLPLAVSTASGSPKPPTIIRPLKERHFRAGVQALAGAPVSKPRGVSWFRGAGVAAEYTPVRNLWLTGSAQWLSYEVNAVDSLSRKYFPDNYPQPDNPKPGKPKDKLIAMQGNPRQQHLELGLRYVIAVPFRIRPSVRVAHSWARIDPGLFSFKYEEKKPGPGPGHTHEQYFVRTPKPRWVDNNWRFGASLEYETTHLVFGLGADYSKSLAANTSSFDAITARASVQYTF